MPQRDGPPHAALSDREYQVFHMLASGRSVSDIAARLNLSGKTVSTHKARLMEKLHVNNPADLIHYALRHRLIDSFGTPD
jgi:DNA-binding NarL/FixJ family response regulator